MLVFCPLLITAILVWLVACVLEARCKARRAREARNELMDTQMFQNPADGHVDPNLPRPPSPVVLPTHSGTGSTMKALQALPSLTNRPGFSSLAFQSAQSPQLDSRLSQRETDHCSSEGESSIGVCSGDSQISRNSIHEGFRPLTSFKLFARTKAGSLSNDFPDDSSRSIHWPILGGVPNAHVNRNPPHSFECTNASPGGDYPEEQRPDSASKAEPTECSIRRYFSDNGPRPPLPIDQYYGEELTASSVELKPAPAKATVLSSLKTSSPANPAESS